MIKPNLIHPPFALHHMLLRNIGSKHIFYSCYCIHCLLLIHNNNNLRYMMYTYFKYDRYSRGLTTLSQQVGNQVGVKRIVTLDMAWSFWDRPGISVVAPTKV